MSDRTALSRMQSAVDAAALQRHLEWLSNVPRDTGGTGEDRAAAYLASELDAAGVPVVMHEFDAFLSYPRQASLRVVAPATGEFRCVTHSFALSTPAAGLERELVFVTGSRFDSARGKIALVDGLATPVTILQASQAGCAGIVFANEDRFIHNMIGTTIWGTPEYRPDRSVPDGRGGVRGRGLGRGAQEMARRRFAGARRAERRRRDRVVSIEAA